MENDILPKGTECFFVYERLVYDSCPTCGTEKSRLEQEVLRGKVLGVWHTFDDGIPLYVMDAGAECLSVRSDWCSVDEEDMDAILEIVKNRDLGPPIFIGANRVATH